MGRVHNVLPLKVITMLYYTLIHPNIVYCNIVWGYAKSSILKKITVLQNRTVILP